MPHVTEEAETMAGELRALISQAMGTEIPDLQSGGSALADTGESDWSGDDHEAWRDHWENHVSPTLTSIGDQLESVSSITESMIAGIFAAGGRTG